MKMLFPEALPRPIPERVAAPLRKMAELGLAKDVIAALLDVFSPISLHRDHLRFLLGPVVQHCSPWMADTPSRLYEAVTAERLRIIIEEHASGELGWQVGHAEVAVVIFPATMEAPLAEEYANLYLWASAHAHAAHLKIPVAEFWELLGGTPVEDSDIITAGGRYHHAYRQLCTDIRRRVVKAQRDRERKPRKPQPPTSTDTIQLDLFPGKDPA